MVELYEASIRAIDRYLRPVFTATPLEPIGEAALLDHAGSSETSQMLFLDPVLVNLAGLPETLSPTEHAVLGLHPELGSAERGQELLVRGLDAWVEWIESDPDLPTHYGHAIAQYDEYRTRFYETSWEQAIRDWWATK